MGRILAIDYGRKRCGIAVSDPLKLIANGLKTVATQDLDAFFEQYLKEETVDLVVVGLGRNGARALWVPEHQVGIGTHA